MAPFGRRNLGPPKPPGGGTLRLKDNVLKDADPSRARSVKDKGEGMYSLLTCLACAQQCDVDFVGISWINAQGVLGRGGQAVVSQTRASADMVFAFKRPDSTPIGSQLSNLTTSQRVRLDGAYRAIASEIIALREPEICSHRNIVRLQAISWEIERVRTWFFGRTTRVWPVLVFETADLGDLGKFMASERGAALDLSARIRLCRDIASAIAVSHQKGIIHGDIKPGNVLVFDEGDPVPKLADFGFAAFASNQLIEITGTKHWLAPEIKSRQLHTLQQAKLSDIFSFGILCLWILFREELVMRGKNLPQPSPPPKGIVASVVSGILKPVGRLLGLTAPALDPDIRLISMHNTIAKGRNTIRALALELVDGSPDSVWKAKLKHLFESALKVDTKKRAQSIEYMMQFLDSQSPSSFTTRLPNTAGRSDRRDGPSTSKSFPAASNFEICKSLQTLCSADFRVREFIFRSLMKEYSDTKGALAKSKLAFQLAVCKKIGFGTSRDPEQATYHLKEARAWQRRLPSSGPKMDDAYLLSQIEQSSFSQKPSNKRLRDLYETGVIQPIHQGLEMAFSSPGGQKEMISERRKEIERMEAALGKTHPAVLNLKWSLLALLESSDDQVAPIEFAHEMAKLLEADERHGPDDRDTLMAKGYRSLSLMRVFPQAADRITARLKETDANLARLDTKDHVLALMVRAAIADCLAFQGHLAQSEEFFQRARAGIVARFGPQHPNTVVHLEKGADRLMRRGKISEGIEILRSAVEDIESLTDPDSGPIGYLRDKLAFLHVQAGEYAEAREVVLGTIKLFEAGGEVLEVHPARADVEMHLGNYAEASRINKLGHDMMLGAGILKEPWPPERLEFDLKKSAAVVELLGMDAVEGGLVIYPDPRTWSVNPDFLMRLAALVVSIQASAQKEEESDNMRNATRLYQEADGYLKKLMKHINDSLGPGSWNGLSDTGGLAGSAMRRVMDEERTPLLELIAFLGDNGHRKGVHYEKGIAVAQEAGYPKITALLAEHRTLCASTPGDRKSPAFTDLTQLQQWVTGDWTGAYLYKLGGHRVDPKGHFTLRLEVSEVQEGGGDSAKIAGSGSNDQGELDVTGEAWLSGEIKLGVVLQGNPGNEGWVNCGVVNMERRALGGYWGFPGATSIGSLGTFFFFKSNEE